MPDWLTTGLIGGGIAAIIGVVGTAVGNAAVELIKSHIPSIRHKRQAQERAELIALLTGVLPHVKEQLPDRTGQVSQKIGELLDEVTGPKQMLPAEKKSKKPDLDLLAMVALLNYQLYDLLKEKEIQIQWITALGAKLSSEVLADTAARKNMHGFQCLTMLLLIEFFDDKHPQLQELKKLEPFIELSPEAKSQWEEIKATRKSEGTRQAAIAAAHASVKPLN